MTFNINCEFIFDKCMKFILVDEYKDKIIIEENIGGQSNGYDVENVSYRVSMNLPKKKKEIFRVTKHYNLLDESYSLFIDGLVFDFENKFSNHIKLLFRNCEDLYAALKKITDNERNALNYLYDIEKEMRNACLQR